MKGFGDPGTWGGQSPEGEWWICHKCDREYFTDEAPDDYICDFCKQEAWDVENRERRIKNEKHR